MIMIQGGGTCQMRWLSAFSAGIKREVTGLMRSSAPVLFHRDAAITGAESCLSGVSAERRGHSFLREGLLHDQWSPTEVSEPRSWTAATNGPVVSFMSALEKKKEQHLNVVIKNKWWKCINLAKPFRNGYNVLMLPWGGSSLVFIWRYTAKVSWKQFFLHLHFSGRNGLC